MKQYDVADVVNALPEIIEEAEIGGTVMLTRENGIPVAAVMPAVAYYEYRRLKAKEAGVPDRRERDFWDAIQDFRARHTPEELEEMDMDGMLADVRARFPDGR